MKKYTIIFYLIFFPFEALWAQVESIKPFVYQSIKTKSNWFSFNEKIYLGMDQSELLAIHKELKPLMNDSEADYHKVLIQRKKSVGDLEVIYTFNDICHGSDSYETLGRLLLYLWSGG